MSSPRFHDSTDPTERSTNSAKEYPVCDQCRIKKVRCGRERPNCSNCARLGIECEWSGYGKRPSQTVMLNNVVVGLEGRIDQLEKNMSDIKEILTKLDSRFGDTPFSTPVTWLTEANGLDLSTHTSGSSSSTPSSYSRYAAMRPGRSRLVNRADGSQQYVGPTTLDSLMNEFINSIVTPLCRPYMQDNVSQDQFMFARDRLWAIANLMDICDSAGKLALTTTPSRGILEAMIEPDFDSINQRLPIWSKDRFREFIANSQQEKIGLPHKSHVICFNSLAILILTTKLISASTHSNSPISSWGSIDLDLIKYFLANTTQAIHNIHELMTPHLSNIQALLYLHLVAKVHWGPERATLFLTLASAGAKQLGLYQWDAPQGYTLEETQERHRVFLCLYTLDKSRCWVDGHPSHVSLWHPDVWVSLQAVDPVVVARARLSQIEEKIFVQLYSDTSGDHSTKQMNQVVACLFQELREFQTDLTLKEPAGQPLSFVEGELKIVECALEAFLYWKLDTEDALMTTATRCISLFLTLWGQNADFGSHLTVIRLLVGYASLSFFQLCSFVILNHTKGSADPVTEVLTSFVAMLRSISHVATSNVPIKKLTEAGDIVLDLCSDQAVGGAQGWPRTLDNDHILPRQGPLLQMSEPHDGLGLFPTTIPSEPMIDTVTGTSALLHSFGFENPPVLLPMLEASMFTTSYGLDDRFAGLDLQRWALELQGSGTHD
ncbi:fungal specific transcription factor [Fusarium heterosporum]|uniref:Fungal specific transcription factor n=1 Tax=Fusarium heterosporum TaxID=42747 RepID=A0A8H5T9T6_FUSHE|nr:fungal specific transcription factor [Fusarium heterosporum]